MIVETEGVGSARWTWTGRRTVTVAKSCCGMLRFSLHGPVAVGVRVFRFRRKNKKGNGVGRRMRKSVPGSGLGLKKKNADWWSHKDKGRAGAGLGTV